nr:acidic endochitinase [Gleditsia microphylla]
MTSKKQVFILLLSLYGVSLIIKSSHAEDCASLSSGKISVFWGTSNSEGTLKEACDSGRYDIVILESLQVSPDGKSRLNLAGHCPGGDCTQLESDIVDCQSQGIQVLLSLGEEELSRRSLHGLPTASSSQDDVTTQFAEYLLENFLSGNRGPLGSVTLDGINIANHNTLEWVELVRTINRSTQERKIYLSASPSCQRPSKLDKVISTGLLDYIWVEFYDNFYSCEYLNENSAGLTRGWEKWTSSVQLNTSVFLGVPASSEGAAASSGYIPPNVLNSEILPTIKKASNYGGVMIWNRRFDKKTNYSVLTRDSVKTTCKCVCGNQAATSGSFYGLLSESL